MTSEIRVNKIENRSGLGTVTFADTGVDLAGIVTATTFSGSGASLTSLPAAQLSGTLPALDGSALTGVASTENIRTNTNATFLQNVNVSGSTTTGTTIVGGGVTISESGIEASGIGITCANINGGQISGRRNLAINGAFIVAQRGTSSTASSGYNTVDRWSQDHGGCDESPTFGTFGVSAPSSPYHLPTSGAHPYKEGFRTAWGVTNGNQTSGAGADDNIIMGYAFEGQDIVRSGWNYLSSSSYVTLSFWIKSSVSQEFFGQLLAPNGTAYNYPFGTGSLTAHTWKKVIKTIPGNSNITIPDSNAAGLRFYLWPFAGTNLTGSVTNDAWQVNNYSTRVSDNTTTWYETNDASVQITGFQLEFGSQATPFEHRSYNEEIKLCERYFQTSFEKGQTPTHGLSKYIYKQGRPYASNVVAGMNHTLRTEMRSTPTLVIYTTVNGSNSTTNYVSYFNGSAWTSGSINVHDSINTKQFAFDGTLSSGFVLYQYNFTCTAEL